ncbi:MAG: preprotein translocase subunit YajC [Phycisphaera sp.]|nr:preprotein translocase subunit YajC [Phycisphaera sp.]
MSQDTGAAPTQGTTTQPGGNGTGTPPQQQPGFGGAWFLPLIAVMFLVMIFLSGRAQRAERKKKDALLSALKKHDRVQTIGGVLGTITEIKGDEVILRIDDANNTRMHFARSAIQQVVRSAAGSKSDSSSSDEPELASAIDH